MAGPDTDFQNTLRRLYLVFTLRSDSSVAGNLIYLVEGRVVRHGAAD
ncbi:MAG: hypothetical protein P8J59_05525 [Phycisphaerales bacterium]|jgi:hypothetical protein|nr:hypothetical protein [Phycisphaerales bacterium]